MSAEDIVSYAIRHDLLPEKETKRVMALMEKRPGRLQNFAGLLRKLERAVMSDLRDRNVKSPFAKRMVNNGDVLLGPDPYHSVVHTYPSMSLNKNVFLVGPPGCGKTTFIFHFLAAVLPLGFVKTLLFDEAKHVLRRLVPVYAKHGQKLHVAKGEEFPLGLFDIAEIVDPRASIEPITVAIGESIAATEPGMRLLREVNYSLFESFGLFGAVQPKRFPTAIDLREAIAGHSTAPVLVKEGLLNRLDPILIGMPGLRYSRGEDIRSILRSHLLLECDGVSTDASNLLKSLIITKAMLLRKQEMP